MAFGRDFSEKVLKIASNGSIWYSNHKMRFGGSLYPIFLGSKIFGN